MRSHADKQKNEVYKHLKSYLKTAVVFVQNLRKLMLNLALKIVNA
jgi:hypothetical protein